MAPPLTSPTLLACLLALAVVASNGLLVGKVRVYINIILVFAASFYCDNIPVTKHPEMEN